MLFLPTRMAGILLAFGIFFTISCTGLKNTEAEQGSAENPGTFDTQLSHLNEQLAKNENDGQIRLKKAELLTNHARGLTPPSSRNPLYQNLVDTAVEAHRLSPGVSEQIQSILTTAWKAEHQEALRLLQDEQQEHYGTITDHLNNAITIAPDSVASYSVLATTHYSHGYYSDAIGTVQSALAVIEDPDKHLRFREKLAYLYFESGAGGKAIEIYRDLVAERPEQIHLRHGLVNALMIHGQHEEAVDALKELMEANPTRVSYQETLAAESYNLFQIKTDNMASGRSENMDQENLLDLLETSNTIYNNLNAQSPMREELTLHAAIFYKQAAQKLEQLVSEPGISAARLAPLIGEYRNSALPYWERLAKINPDNTEYMFHLYELYVQLDLTDEAGELEKTYNFNAL